MAGKRCVEVMRHATRILNWIKTDGAYEDRVEQVIACLHKNGVPQRVYDDRVNEYVEPDKVKPAEYRRWMARVNGDCVVTAMAENEFEARRELMKEFGRCVANDQWGSSYALKFEQWMREGTIAELDANRKYPDMRPIAEIIKPMKEPAVKTEAAA